VSPDLQTILELQKRLRAAQAGVREWRSIALGLVLIVAAIVLAHYGFFDRFSGWEDLYR
jgi:hypothetical protein